jgi:hypothetical protein
MKTSTIVYIDDQLNPEVDTLENRTLRSLNTIFSVLGVKIHGFFRLEDAQKYFLNPENTCDLLVSDQNLWWGGKENQYPFRDGNKFVASILLKREDLKEMPVIVYTDSPGGVRSRWSNDGIQVKDVIEKCNYDPHDPRKHWEILADSIKKFLPKTQVEGNEGYISKER